MKRIFLSFAAIATYFSAFAHEGHGHTHGFTIQHYFVEPEHAILVVAFAAAVVLLVKKYRKAAAKK
ncbi:MAG TPA: hypothetical protein PKA77_07195 [Chitinophagaceae bacterium]|jgi:hypothetical protein|nr:hypothetical protein [Chitinophagaceae bacterium]HMU57941.1 hypothetical protein [Chitinophagaceae bacterium]